MDEFLRDYGFWLMIGVPALLGFIGIIAIKVATGRRKARVAECEAKLKIAECEAKLKQEMVQRGMSADEIMRVLQTAPSAVQDNRQLEIGELMVKKRYQAANILQVVKAWSSLEPGVQAVVRALVEKGTLFIAFEAVLPEPPKPPGPPTSRVILMELLTELRSLAVDIRKVLARCQTADGSLPNGEQSSSLHENATSKR